MGTAGRSAPLRSAGSLLGLLGLELAAVLGLHWLGRFAGLRIRWDEPVPWLLSSPVQEVLGAVLRTVGLVMAYWLLASTLLYLLARLTRLPSAVRAVRWATLPLVRRVADHAVAVTLATSMVGGSTLGVAAPALAADRRDGAGPPAGKPVAAAQATSTTAYGFQTPDSSAEPTTGPTELPGTTTSTSSTTTSTSSTTTTTQPPTTTTEPPTTTTQPPTTTTEPPTTTTEPPTTTTTQRSATTTREATTTTARGAAPAPPAYRFGAAGQPPPPSTTSGATTTTPTTRPRPPAYEFTPATPTTNPSAGREAGGGGGPGPGGGSGGSTDEGGSRDEGTGAGQGQEQTYEVVRGDNLWTIARNHLARARSGGSGEPTNREVADYWARVVEANRDGLRSGDPDLIYPGEEITLPPVD